MARLRLGRSYWLDTFEGTAPRLPRLRGRVSADVAIVGGGVTGCAAAMLFARAGATVILVEGQRIGRGSSAASTALLMQEPDVDLGDLSRRYGVATARRIWRCSRAAVTAMQRTFHELGVAEIHTLPSLYFTRDAAMAPGLRREAAARRRAGLPARWLSAAATHTLAGFDTAGAILTAGNAQADPYEACLALADAAMDAGAGLFERSPVRKIEASSHGVTLALTDATIAADWAVIATGYATPEFKRLSARFKMMNTYVIATPRLGRAVRRQMGLGDVMLWDTERPYHYLRWTRDRRLLFGGLDRPRVPRAIRPATLRQRAVTLMAQLVDLYPALEGLRPEYAWEGLFATTPDGLPYIGKHRHHPRQLFALGYGGNGMTLGFLAAQTLVRIAQGRARSDDELFSFGRRQGRM